MEMTREDLGRLAHRAADKAFQSFKPPYALMEWESLPSQIREGYCCWAERLLDGISMEQHEDAIRRVVSEQAEESIRPIAGRIAEEKFEERRAELEAAVRANERERIARLAEEHHVPYLQIEPLVDVREGYMPSCSIQRFADLIRSQS